MASLFKAMWESVRASRRADVTPRFAGRPNNLSRARRSSTSQRVQETRMKLLRFKQSSRNASRKTWPRAGRTTLACPLVCRSVFLSSYIGFTCSCRVFLGVKMRNLWSLFLVGLATGFISEKVSSFQLRFQLFSLHQLVGSSEVLASLDEWTSCLFISPCPKTLISRWDKLGYVSNAQTTATFN